MSIGVRQKNGVVDTFVTNDKDENGGFLYYFLVAII